LVKDSEIVHKNLQIMRGTFND